MSIFRSRLWHLATLVVIVAIVLGMSGTRVFAALPANIFELDGNAVDSSPASLPDDWGALYNGGANDGGTRPPLAAFSGVVADAPNSTIFTTGGSKDDLDITNWRHTNGSVPDKDELTNAYAAAYINNGELIVYFGADRFATNGNAALGFWFLQQDVGPRADGTFSGAHEPKDVLVLSEFTNGGSQPTIQVYEWVPGGPINGTLRLLTDVSSACNTAAGQAADACAIVNTGNSTAPWPYKPKSGAAGIFGKGAFFEGAINLTKLFGNQTPCISSFIAETRSSQTVDATLKDFDAGDFNLCGANINIGPDAVNEVGDPHTFEVEVNQTIGGVASPAADGTTATVTLTHSIPNANVTTLADTCAFPGTSGGTCSVTFTTNMAGTVTGHAKSTVPVGETSVTVETGTSANSPDATKYFVDAAITIDPDGINSVGQQHVFTIDASAIKSSGVSVTGYSITPNITPAPAQGAISDTCSNLGTEDTASCTVTINSNTVGTFTANASVTVSYSIASGNPNTVTVTRNTVGNSGPGGSDAAFKEYRAGSISLTKNVEFGPFTAAPRVCYTLSRTDNGPAITPLTTSANPQCHQYVKPTDSHNFTWAGLASGTYTLTESSVSVPYTPHGPITGIIVDATGASPNVNAGTASNPLPPGSLAIAKTVNGGSVPSGVQFDFAVFACTGATIGTCNTNAAVATPKAPNLDGTPVVVNNLSEGYYLIRETGVPAGYQIDPATQDQITQVFAGNVGGLRTVTFNNLLQYKLIVVTCSQADNKLVDSTVTLNNVSKETVKPNQLNGITEAQLCTVLGATYGNLNAGNYTPSVELPDAAPSFP